MPSLRRVAAATILATTATALVAPVRTVQRPSTARHGIDVNVWDYTYDNQDARVALPASADEADPSPAPFAITAAQKDARLAIYSVGRLSQLMNRVGGRARCRTPLIRWLRKPCWAEKQAWCRFSLNLRHR